MKKRFSVFLLFLMGASGLFAQKLLNDGSPLSALCTQGTVKNYIYIKQDAVISPDILVSIYKSSFGLGERDRLEQKNIFADQIGQTHYRYQQTCQGVPVLGADIVVHTQQGKAVSVNGRLIKGLNVNTSPAISADAAIQKAISFVGADRFMWEDPKNEEMLKHISGNLNATYYPAAELVILDRQLGTDPAHYRLAWKVNVYAQNPLSYQDIYIDAQSGSVYHIINRIKTTEVTGTALTKYSGSQSIQTDSTAPSSFRLRESGRGSGIETYNMATGTNYSAATDFTDTDNFWNNVNAAKDEVATDAHWGAEMTYDYYWDKFGRNSYDNLGSKLVSFVHYDVNYENAFWDGTRMTYGDGSSSYSPFTSLDVCGHEITHGVTEYSANLIYQDEPGALNESFSDMFGAAIEFYALNGAGDWLVGEDFDLSGDGFRNMANPNADGQPDTYLGTDWYVGDFDQGGVHTNSGVANYWFYLLSVGGTGTNDKGHHYAVTGQGIDTAAAIAYRALTVYLTSSSDYADCRAATLQAACDIYGLCSDAYIECANAWYAVGVGMAITDNDFSILNVSSPQTACGLGMVNVSVHLLYNGCNVSVPAGDTIHFSYVLDGAAPVSEMYILPSPVAPGDTLDFTFTTQADVSVIGMHVMDFAAHYTKDTLNYNDTLVDYSFENKLYQNIDVGVTKIVAPASSCNLNASEHVSVLLQFFGCDYLPAGETIQVAYSVNGGSPVEDSLTLGADLYPGSEVFMLFAEPYDFSNSGTYTIDAWTHYTPDTLTSNDHAPVFTVKKPLLLADTTVTFEESNVNDFFLVHTTNYSHAMVSTNAEHTGNKGFLMTGGNPMAYYNLIELPTGNNTWNINEFLSAKIDFCVNATAWTEANLTFDLKQTFGEQAYNAYLGAGDYTVASNLRVLVNDSIQIGGTYNPVTAGSDPYNTRFVNLDDYAGTYFTLSFETRNLSKDTLFFTMDNAYLDNIIFSEESHVGITEAVNDGGFSLYPNPSDGHFWINYFAEKQMSVVAGVYDISGKCIQTSSFDLMKGDNSLRFNLEDAPAGVYYLRIGQGSDIKSLPFVLE
jgi:Zn-dependent metalloprotease